MLIAGIHIMSAQKNTSTVRTKANYMNKEIEHFICQFVDEYAKAHKPQTVWREPVVGFADASDPMFAKIQEIVGSHHLLPSDLLPGARSVIVFFPALLGRDQ